MNRNGVEIRGNFVSFAELHSDVQSAYRRGYGGTFAFNPETVEALLDYIDKINNQSKNNQLVYEGSEGDKMCVYYLGECVFSSTSKYECSMFATELKAKLAAI